MTVVPGDFTGKGDREVLEWDVRLSPINRTRPAGIGLVVVDGVAIEEAFEGIRYLDVGVGLP